MDQSSPTSNFNQIFHDLNDPVECVDEYTPGGYHPVRLGDRLRDDRYLVLRKLGYGSYSTVWLARDREYIGKFHLNPLADFTDIVYRNSLLSKLSKPDVAISTNSRFIIPAGRVCCH